MLPLPFLCQQRSCCPYLQDPAALPLMVLPATLQDILIGQAKLMGNNTVKYSLPGRVDVGGTVTARDIMIATGSVPFVPPGIPIDGKTVSHPDKLLSPEQTLDLHCAA